MKYKICPNCGAHLDHGEACDCQQIEPTEGITPDHQREPKESGESV